MQPQFEISVILAEAKENPDLGGALAAIEHACAGLLAEVIVVRPRGREALPASSALAIREVVAGEETLVPERWGLGVAVSRAPVFGCLTSELFVRPDWARTLIGALNQGAAGAAGTIAIVPHAGMVAAAVYLVRFNAFLPRRDPGAESTGNIPGDAAAYRRDAVLAYPELLAEGFWEAEFHRRFRADGIGMTMFNQPLAAFNSAITLRSAMTVRARHGHGFGVTRVTRYRESALRLLLAAPAVPLVLFARLLQRAARSSGAFVLAVRSFPALILLCGAWAWGEATGAWAARSAR